MDMLYDYQTPDGVKAGKARIRAELLAIMDRYEDLTAPIGRSISEGRAAIQAALLNIDWTDPKRKAEAERLRQETYESAVVRMGAARTEIMGKLEALEAAEAAKLKISTGSQAYVMAAANAYKTIEMLGEHILHDQLTGLCQTFIEAGDSQTLSIIKGMCEKYCPTLLDFCAEQGNPFDFGQNTPGILQVIRSIKGYMAHAFRVPSGDHDAAFSGGAIAAELARQEIRFLTAQNETM